jgi:predicted AlkP superfamily phosphohydrolase/phosphomutase
MTDGDRTPTVVLGFDALSEQYLDTFEVPNFDSLRTAGTEAPLESTFPPWTGSAWPSMYTGMDPSGHGVYSFFDFDGRTPAEADLITRGSVKSPALWDYLSFLDIPSIVLNIPVTHPAERINGVLVPGYLAPEETSGYPEGIREELSTAIDEEYHIYADSERTIAPWSVEGLVELIEMRRSAAKWLLEAYDWELAVVQVQKTDTVFHQFNNVSAFEQVYAAADRFVSMILDTVGTNANVIVCSDHGIGPTSGYKIYVNEVLRRHGFVSITTSGETPTLERHKNRLVTPDTVVSTDDPSMSKNVISAIHTVLRYGGVTVGDVYAVARKLGIDSVLSSVLTDEMRATLNQSVDWNRSRAYCRNAAELGIRINLKGREPRGVVSQSEYEEVRSRLIRVLSELTVPDGTPAFEFVTRREDVYSGPFTEYACDVVFMPSSMNNVVAANILGREFISIDSFNHKRAGVFIADGPDVDTSTELGQLSLTDVAPITMALLGCDVPERMTGDVPDGLVDREISKREYGDVRFGTATSSQTKDDQVEKLLDELGYL